MTLDMTRVREVVRMALDEDLGSGDVTTGSTMPPETVAKAKIVAKEAGIVAGTSVAREAFVMLSSEVRFDSSLSDGRRVHGGDVIIAMRGPAVAILSGERVALNFLQRLSGIATLTARFVEAVAGTGARILDTRKTTPGLRFMEKYAVAVGGGHNHRMGLYDMALIKDNHIKVAGGIVQAVRAVRASHPGMGIEVEVSTLEQVIQALEAGVKRIMLDNMNPIQLKEAVDLVRARGGSGRKTQLEASGNVQLENVRQIAETGVDDISIGALTHSVPALDVSLVLTGPISPGGHEKP
jgi:nicotinate-nucleotide pyrophosphorylase (carboxylating)